VTVGGTTRTGTTTIPTTDTGPGVAMDGTTTPGFGDIVPTAILLCK